MNQGWQVMPKQAPVTLLQAWHCAAPALFYQAVILQQLRKQLQIQLLTSHDSQMTRELLHRLHLLRHCHQKP